MASSQPRQGTPFRAPLLRTRLRRRAPASAYSPTRDSMHFFPASPHRVAKHTRTYPLPLRECLWSASLLFLSPISDFGVCDGLCKSGANIQTSHLVVCGVRWVSNFLVNRNELSSTPPTPVQESDRVVRVVCSCVCVCVSWLLVAPLHCFMTTDVIFSQCPHGN